MNRFVATAILTTILSGASFASDPSSPRVAKVSGPRVSYLSVPDGGTVTFADNLPGAERVLELVVSPISAVVRFVRERDPNFRMNRLLNESEDFGQVREEMRRFWMNNQPSVLNYERLKGAVGP